MGRGKNNALAAQTTRQKQYKLLDTQGQEYLSSEPGQLGGYKPNKLYGQLELQHLSWQILAARRGASYS